MNSKPTTPRDSYPSRPRRAGKPSDSPVIPAVQPPICGETFRLAGFPGGSAADLRGTFRLAVFPGRPAADTAGNLPIRRVSRPSSRRYGGGPSDSPGFPAVQPPIRRGTFRLAGFPGRPAADLRGNLPTRRGSRPSSRRYAGGPSDLATNRARAVGPSMPPLVL